MSQPQDASCGVPKWWPLAVQKAWAGYSSRLFAQEGQDIMIEGAIINTDGWFAVALTVLSLSGFELPSETSPGTRAVRIRSEEKLAKYLCVWLCLEAGPTVRHKVSPRHNRIPRR